MKQWILARLLLILVVLAALLGGLGSGLARLGWQMDSLSQSWILIHGPLMISGFLGTLICLERAVALFARSRWVMLVPLLSAAGALGLLLGRDALVAKLLLTLSSAGLLLLFRWMLRLHPSRDMAIMALGAFVWLVGNVLWLIGEPIYQVVHLWTAFLILTIVGERLELSRVRRLPPSSEQALVLAVGIYALGILLTIGTLDLGIRVFGMGALLISLWLFRYDLARRTIRQTGLPRYIAACLLSGYGWLFIGGLLALWQGAVYGGLIYAALLHALLLGFVFSMIFGHAPIILPAVTGLQLTYHPVFYLHLLLLHSTLLYRLYGNLTGEPTAIRWGGLLNVASVLLFMAITILTVIRSNIHKQSG